MSVSTENFATKSATHFQTTSPIKFRAKISLRLSAAGEPELTHPKIPLRGGMELFNLRATNSIAMGLFTVRQLQINLDKFSRETATIQSLNGVRFPATTQMTPGSALEI